MNRIIVKNVDLVSTDRLNSLINKITPDVRVDRKIHQNRFVSLYLEPCHVKIYPHDRLTIMEV